MLVTVRLEAVMNSIRNGLGMRETRRSRGNQADCGIRISMRFSPKFITRSRTGGLFRAARPAPGRHRAQIFPGEERSARGDDAAPAGTGRAALRGRGTPSRSAPPRG